MPAHPHAARLVARLQGAAQRLVAVVTGRSAPAAAAPAFRRRGARLTLRGGGVTIRYDLGTGLVDLRWATGASLTRAYASVRLRAADGVPAGELRSFDATTRRATRVTLDGTFGRGLQLRVAGDHPDHAASLTQTFTVFAARPLVLLRVTAARSAGAGADAPLATDQIEIVAAGGVTDPPGKADLGAATDPRFFRMPFDNNDQDIAVLPAADQQPGVSY